jgi:dTDP-4-amino-4,6-dideoxygalactose transaminase
VSQTVQGAAGSAVRQQVPFVDLGRQHQEIAAELAAGWQAVVRESSFIGGTAVREFERALADFCQVGHCVGVANGTDALELCLRAAGLDDGDEVIVPANTFVATAEAVVAAGGRPVLADVDPTYLLLSPDCVGDAITSRTRVLLPVHLYGQIAPMEELLAACPDVLVVEDAAQSMGASLLGRPAGSWGLLSATSFYPGKNLGACGDGGAVLTDSAELAGMVRLLANHGSSVRYEHELVGRNSRLDTMQAVVLLLKLQNLTKWNLQRRAAAGLYNHLLADAEAAGDVVLPRQREDAGHVWHLFPVRVATRDKTMDCLEVDGIQVGIHYPHPIHLQKAFKYLGYRPGQFPVSEAAARQMISLPIFPGITVSEQERVVDSLRRALGHGR